MPFKSTKRPRADHCHDVTIAEASKVINKPCAHDMITKGRKVVSSSSIEMVNGVYTVIVSVEVDELG